jgi:hypothetical protein
MVTKRSDGSGRDNDLDQLWQWLRHENDVLVARVSVFLLAQSILIAVTASLVNTLVGAGDKNSHIKPEIFALALILSLAGLALALLFWYVFLLNFDNIGAVQQELNTTLGDSENNIWTSVRREQRRRRDDHWSYRLIFRRKGMNWIIVHALPVGAVILWCAMLAFGLAAFFTQ